MIDGNSASEHSVIGHQHGIAPCPPTIIRKYNHSPVFSLTEFLGIAVAKRSVGDVVPINRGNEAIAGELKDPVVKEVTVDHIAATKHRLARLRGVEDGLFVIL